MGANDPPDVLVPPIHHEEDYGKSSGNAKPPLSYETDPDPRKTTFCTKPHDPSAHLVAFIHMDNSYYGSIDMSQKKAKTVVLFNGQFPSHGLYNRTQPGPGNDLWSLQTSNDGLVVFPGGQPIYDHDGYFIGAVGVSGGTVEQDVDVAIHAAEAIGTTLKLDL